jgi:TonB-dependent receptor
MYSHELSNKLSLIAGGRYEQTKVNYSGRRFDGETISNTSNESDDYSNFLPSVALNFNLDKWTNIKTAWTNSIARPNYFDLVPYQEIDTEDNRIKIGNPGLDATESSNFDIIAEHFFNNVGVLSAGVYYKKLSNVIADKVQSDVMYLGSDYDRLTQPQNIGNADLFGIELGLQRRLDFLPSVLSNLSFYANYTYNKSKLSDITLDDREDEELPLAGTPKNLFNISLAYDTKPMDFRLSYNSASSFIEEYGDEAFYDRWYDSVNYLDFNIDYRINKTWELYFSLNNLLNQPLRYYQGVTERTMQVEYYGIHTKFGLKFRII